MFTHQDSSRAPKLCTALICKAPQPASLVHPEGPEALQGPEAGADEVHDAHLEGSNPSVAL